MSRPPAIDLDRVGGSHPFAHGRGGAPRGARTPTARIRPGLSREGVGRLPHHRQVHVEAVDERTRYAGLVAPYRFGQAPAALRAVAEVAAGAGVHRRDELETGRKLRLAGGAHDGDAPGLERFAQHVQDRTAELRELVQKEQAMVGERDLARPRRHASPDEPDRRDRVVGRADGPLAPRSRVALEAAGGVDGHGLERLRFAHRREQSRQAVGEHGLAGAGRADHEHVVPAGGRDLEDPLGRLLTPHVREVGSLDRKGVRHRGGERLDRRSAEEVTSGLGEVRYRKEPRRAREGRLAGISGGEYQATRRLAGRHRARHRPPDRLHGAVQGQLADDLHLGKPFGGNLSGRGQYAERDGQIEPASLLGQIGRAEVDDHPPVRVLKVGCDERGPDPVRALADRGGRQSHQGGAGQTPAQVHLHGDERSLEPEQRPGAGESERHPGRRSGVGRGVGCFRFDRPDPLFQRFHAGLRLGERLEMAVELLAGHDVHPPERRADRFADVAAKVLADLVHRQRLVHPADRILDDSRGIHRTFSPMNRGEHTSRATPRQGAVAPRPVGICAESAWTAGRTASPGTVVLT